ncbi:MAG: SGNH/GDSL hydrolase family protein [Gemmatimonadaceae bacterium]
MEPRKRAFVAAGWIRDVWIALGIALLAFAALEAAYVTQRAIRAAWFGSDSEREAQENGHPYAGQDWYRDFLGARETVREKFDPWRGYWSYATASRYLNIDSTAQRLTVHPVERVATVGRTVYLLGGSAMWGFTSRDSLTIPSLVAAGLHSAGITDVAVVNLAQPGYTVGHELATLVQELNKGRTPAIAVFYDGVNDIRTTQLYQEPGHAFFEQRFSHLYEVESQRGFFGSLVTPGERSKLVSRIILALGLNDEWAIPPQKPGNCQRLGGYFRNVHQNAVALGKQWGFEVLFVQQPIQATTRKQLTAFERSFMPPPRILNYSRECAVAIDSALAELSGTNYLSYASLFDDSSETVFIDRFGHVTEAANQRIANSLVEAITTRLERRAAADLVPPARSLR